MKKHSGENISPARDPRPIGWIGLNVERSCKFERFMDIRAEDTSPSDISREIPGWYVYRHWIIRRQKTYWWTARSAIDLTITYITLWLKTSIDIYPRLYCNCTYCVCVIVRVYMCMCVCVCVSVCVYAYCVFLVCIVYIARKRLAALVINFNTNLKDQLFLT